MTPSTSPGLPRRLAALLYDTFLILPLIMFSVALAMGLQALIAGAFGGPVEAEQVEAWLVRVLTLVTIIGFYCAFWRLKGQTLGMQAWRIRLRRIDGTEEPVSLRQALLRCVGALLSLLPLGAGYWWCLFDQHGRYWHDYLSRTELELLPKKK